jgi:hypothetical protein
MNLRKRSLMRTSRVRLKLLEAVIVEEEQNLTLLRPQKIWRVRKNFHKVSAIFL